MLFLSCHPRCDYPKDYLDFTELSLDRQHAEFRYFPIERQVDYYLYKMCAEPPGRDFVQDIAIRGEEVIPYLIKRIQKESNDYQKYDMLIIFQDMQVYSVDLRHRRDVMDSLDLIVSQMKDSSSKKMGEDTIKFIRNYDPKQNRNPVR